MNDFCMQTVVEGNVPVLSVNGYVGREECSRVIQELSGLERNGKDSVVLDCTRASCITNGGLESLNLWAQEYRQHGGQFRLAGLSRAARYNALLIGFENQVVTQLDVPSVVKSLSGRDSAAAQEKNRGQV